MPSNASSNDKPPLTLLDGKPKYEAFCQMQHLVNVSQMAPSTKPLVFGDTPRIELPQTYEHFGVQKSLQSLLDNTHTSALLVLEKGKVRYENYWLTGGREVQWLSMSLAKSSISALVGIAVSEGRIRHLEDPIAGYVAGLRNPAYGTSHSDEDNKDEETLFGFRAICREFD